MKSHELEEDCRRILILTADAGFGHRSAANAISAAMKDRYPDQCDPIIVNPLDDDRTPFFLRDSQADYDAIIHHAPELYKLGYDVSDGILTGAIVESALTVLLFEVMRDLIKKYDPSAIITTYPLYQAPLFAVTDILQKQIPILTSVTDLATVHKLWFNANVATCLVPTEAVRDLAISNSIPPARIEITGIPVNPQILKEQRSKAQIRADLGWIHDLPTFLAVGSRRVENLLETLNVLNHFGGPLQLAVVAGKDEQLYQALQAVDWHVPVHLYEYTTRMPALLKAADAVICKAGGLIVSEALASGVPLMLLNVIPGQETGNAAYVIDNRAGQHAASPIQALEITAHWLKDNGTYLREQAANARAVGKPDSAYRAAELVWQAASTDASERPDLEEQRRARLIELLNRHKVRWQDNLSIFKR